MTAFLEMDKDERDYAAYAERATAKVAEFLKCRNDQPSDLPLTGICTVFLRFSQRATRTETSKHQLLSPNPGLWARQPAQQSLQEVKGKSIGLAKAAAKHTLCAGDAALLSSCEPRV